jgi:opacity protein-like surface antigen
MKTIILLWVGTIFILATMPSSFAQQVVQQRTEVRENSTIPANAWELSVQGGGVFPSKDDRFDNTGFVAGRLTYDVSPYVAIGAESGWMMFKDEVGGTKFGKIDGIPALGDLELKMPIPATDNRLVPYAIGGAGVVFWNYRESGVLKNAGVKVDTETHFAAKGGVGVDYYFTNNMALFAEGSYLYSRFAPKIHGGGTAVTTKAQTGAFLVGGGLKLRF